MSIARPKATFEVLKSVYLALKNDDAKVLESVVKTNQFNVNQVIAVYDDTYEPVNQSSLFNKNRETSNKTAAEIAYNMGHVKCLEWLLDNGADIKPVIKASIALTMLPDEHINTYGSRFIDDKTNYQQVASLTMKYVDKLSPEELNSMRRQFFTTDEIENVSKPNPAF